jgi:hypothetical protein
MAWANLDDGFYDHPKVIMVGNAAAGIFARMLAYCSRYGTDGMVPSRTVTYIVEDDHDALQRLYDAGMLRAWESGGVDIPDYLDYNRSKAQVEADREAKRTRAQKAADARWAGNAGRNA